MAATFSNTYLLDENDILGKGAFSIVYRATHKVTGQGFAVKVIDLRPLRLRPGFDSKRLLREVSIMRQCSHAHIVGFVDEFCDADKLFMVMELCEGRELFDEILARGYYSEADARPIFRQLSSALAFLHARSIVHRDVKPENCKVHYKTDGASERGNAPVVKLLDFGLAKGVDGAMGSAAKTFVGKFILSARLYLIYFYNVFSQFQKPGTPCYLAPEIEQIARGIDDSKNSEMVYGVEVDCWSLGATLYVMLLSRFPEFDRVIPNQPVVKLTGPVWDGVSAEAKDLIRALMEPDPAARLTAEQALSHPWTQGSNMLQIFSASEAIVPLPGRPSSTIAERPENFVNRPPPLPFLTFNDAASTQAAYPMSLLTDLSSSKSPVSASSGAAQQEPLAMVAMRKDQSEIVDGGARDFGKMFMHHNQKVCGLFAEALLSSSLPKIKNQVRARALEGRTLMLETANVLQHLDVTADRVLESMQDVTLAVNEDEPLLGHKLMELQKSWLSQLREKAQRAKMLNDEMIKSVTSLQFEIDVPTGNVGGALQEQKESEQATTVPHLTKAGDLESAEEGLQSLQSLRVQQDSSLEASLDEDFVTSMMVSSHLTPPSSPGKLSKKSGVQLPALLRQVFPIINFFPLKHFSSFLLAADRSTNNSNVLKNSGGKSSLFLISLVLEVNC
jgi:serine/threonine protein kinase